MHDSVTVRVHGAAGEVTGSCYELRTPRARVLVDFGMFQGSLAQEARNLVPPDIDFADVDAIVVTHAHVDHVGRLGMLDALGFEGRILCTAPTADLLPRVLIGSATLQRIRLEEHASGTLPDARVVEPAHLVTPRVTRTAPPPVLFGHRAAERIVRRIEAIPYGAWTEIADGVRMRLLDAAHVLGAACVEFEVSCPGRERVRVMFSGDVGPARHPLLGAHGMTDRAPDLLVMESTNGGRRFRCEDPWESMHAIIEEAVRLGQRVIIPVFALGRAQSVLQLLTRASRGGALRGTPVYLDTAMAVRASDLHMRYPDLLADAPKRDVRAGRSPLHFDELHSLTSRRESEALDRVHGACVIMAGSGFCDAGPILRHLMHAIDREDARIVFTGHQIEGLLGDGIMRGATRVEINGAPRNVRARIDRIEGVSGHADADDLMDWVAAMPGTPAKIALTHGTAEGRASFARELHARLGISAIEPSIGDLIAV
jgi:metallo-beta-lactamase family protein